MSKPMELLKIAKGLGENCPNFSCDNRGYTVEFYDDYEPMGEDDEQEPASRTIECQEQCEFCHCNPCSVFRVYEKLMETERKDE